MSDAISGGLVCALSVPFLVRSALGLWRQFRWRSVRGIALLQQNAAGQVWAVQYQLPGGEVVRVALRDTRVAFNATGTPTQVSILYNPDAPRTEAIVAHDYGDLVFGLLVLALGLHVLLT